ncbi:peptide-methionine (S)-S-oxide reductase MsrA [Notoacmeibacter sp. MSK16QG-6]|uniref:peptide-methionine (S)-S-oxide reductase MsrA n=1 Tax=Notoacmeibacter sp. MSK16QG-6 TaxID=2957982 RepID=UPI00209DF1D8|nr:peptide-methionine (S)-S-oxide reductase MsrA [Notoacmeibacter sp. MSK16QG-6]MCP1199218.1 peptide-methionine (S)-S-oxide reductase MsrA [Notoacmeibacter sp. MSK16QG-6]
MARRYLAAAFALCLSSTSFAVPAFAETAIFAGGCFWCVESDFDKVDGVSETVSGYIGGKTDDPTYKTYEAGGHREAVRITYDPGKVSYGELVGILLHSIDVTDDGGQFCDRGHGYTSAIYPVSEDQASEADAAKAAAEKELGANIVTPVEGVVTADAFTDAEDYHQDYYTKDDFRLSPGGVTAKAAYKYYRAACGRDDRVREVWGDKAFEGIDGLS